MNGIEYNDRMENYFDNLNPYQYYISILILYDIALLFLMHLISVTTTINEFKEI